MIGRVPSTRRTTPRLPHLPLPSHTLTRTRTITNKTTVNMTTVIDILLSPILPL